MAPIAIQRQLETSATGILERSLHLRNRCIDCRAQTMQVFETLSERERDVRLIISGSLELSDISRQIATLQQLAQNVVLASKEIEAWICKSGQEYEQHRVIAANEAIRSQQEAAERSGIEQLEAENKRVNEALQRKEEEARAKLVKDRALAQRLVQEERQQKEKELSSALEDDLEFFKAFGQPKAKVLGTTSREHDSKPKKVKKKRATSKKKQPASETDAFSISVEEDEGFGTFYDDVVENDKGEEEEESQSSQKVQQRPISMVLPEE